MAVIWLAWVNLWICVHVLTLEIFRNPQQRAANHKSAESDSHLRAVIHKCADSDPQMHRKRFTHAQKAIRKCMPGRVVFVNPNHTLYISEFNSLLWNSLFVDHWNKGTIVTPYLKDLAEEAEKTSVRGGLQLMTLQLSYRPRWRNCSTTASTCQIKWEHDVKGFF